VDSLAAVIGHSFVGGSLAEEVQKRSLDLGSWNVLEVLGESRAELVVDTDQDADEH
jgi:hypothetical protein